MTLWESMPPSLVLRALLVRGGAFSAEYEFWNEGVKQRTFVVVNHDPAADDKLMLLTATTKIQKRELHHGSRAKDVLVYLTPDEYPDIKQESVIDCDCQLIKRTKSDFESHVKDRKYKPLSPLPAEVMERICACVRVAKTLSTIEKRLVLGPEPNGY